MNGWAALMRAVCENPDDDTPRLVLADWLDEHGDPDRAEFIRVQIELARALTIGQRSRPVDRLLKRQGSLLTLWEVLWRRDLPGTDGLLWGHFTRGFVESLTVHAAEPFFDDIEELFSGTPLRDIEIGCRFDLRRFIASPYFTRVRKLVLAGKAVVTATGLQALAARTNIDHIQLLMVAHHPSLQAELSALERRFGDRFHLWGE